MLVLTRKVGEKITIGTADVVVEICRVQGNKVTVGVTAPSGVRVLRAELKDIGNRPRG